MEQKKVGRNLVPPDGGWGWMVVLGSAFVLLCNQPLISAFGLIYGDEIEKLGGQTQASALVANVMFLVINFSGPVSGYVIKKISYRYVTVIGSIITGCGVIGSSFATEIWHLIVTYGIVAGIGMGLIQSSTFVAVNAYFKSKRGRAVGLSLAGAGVGQVIMPQIVKLLHETYDFSGSTMIIGALCLNGIVGGMVLQPVSKHMKVESIEDTEEKHLLMKKISKDMTDLRVAVVDNESEDPQKTVNAGAVSIKEAIKTGREAENEKIGSRLRALVANLDLKLLKSVKFLTVCFGCALAHTSTINFGVVFPFFLLEQANLDMRQTAFAMSFLSGADILGRIFVPMVTDKLKVDAALGLMIGCAWMGIARQVMAYQTDYTAIVVLAGIVGIGKTFVIVNQNLAVSDQCRREQVPTAIGLYMATKGIIVLPVGMIAGWVRDYTASYILCIWSINIMSGLVVLLLLPQYIYDKIVRRK